MPDETIRKKIVIDSDELRLVEKDMKKIAADLKQAAKGESQLRLEKLEGQKARLRGKAGNARRRSIKGFGTQQLATAGVAAASVAFADKALDLLLRYSRTRDFRKALEEQMREWLDSVPVIGKIRQLIREENLRDGERLKAQIKEEMRLADVAGLFSGSSHRRTEARLIEFRRYSAEQERIRGLQDLNDQRF